MDNLWLKVENIVTKGEIALLSKFSFCHTVFKKLSTAKALESVYMRERVKTSLTVVRMITNYWNIHIDSIVIPVMPKFGYELSLWMINQWIYNSLMYKCLEICEDQQTGINSLIYLIG